MAFDLKSAIFDLRSRWKRWWLGRQWRYLLPGLPALVVGLGSLGLIGFALAEGNRDLTARYLEGGKARAKAGDFAGAMTCYERLTSLGEDRPDVVYGLARAAESAGYVERAVVLMRELAPPGERGYGDAHLWWAKHLLRYGGKSKQNLDQVERHLLNALDARVEERELAHGLLGMLYLDRGNLDQAEPHLRKSVEVNPQLQLRLAELYLARGNLQRGRNAAEQAARFYQGWARSDLYARQGRLGLADARILLGEFPEALAALREGLNATGDPVYRKAISRVYVAWSHHVAKTKKDSLGEQLDLAEKALEADPDNTDLVLGVWAMTNTVGKEGDQAIAVLRKQLSNGKATALTHLALGMHAWKNAQPGGAQSPDPRKQTEALLHLEQAYKLQPGMALVANNLAWILANAQPPDLKRALSLINSVLERWPNEPMFRDTRGFIHFRLGNWKDALSDYQAVLPAYADQPDIHKRLAAVYDKLGLKEMSAEHSQRASELETRKKK